MTRKVYLVFGPSGSGKSFLRDIICRNKDNIVSLCVDDMEEVTGDSYGYRVSEMHKLLEGCLNNTKSDVLIEDVCLRDSHRLSLYKVLQKCNQQIQFIQLYLYCPADLRNERIRSRTSQLVNRSTQSKQIAASEYRDILSQTQLDKGSRIATFHNDSTGYRSASRRMERLGLLTVNIVANAADGPLLWEESDMVAHTVQPIGLSTKKNEIPENSRLSDDQIRRKVVNAIMQKTPNNEKSEIGKKLQSAKPKIIQIIQNLRKEYSEDRCVVESVELVLSQLKEE